MKKAFISLFCLFFAFLPTIKDPEPINSEAIIKGLIEKLKQRFKEIEQKKYQGSEKKKLVDQTIKDFFIGESVMVDNFYEEGRGRSVSLRDMLMNCGTAYNVKAMEYSYKDKTLFCKDAVNNPFTIAMIDIDFSTFGFATNSTNNNNTTQQVQVFFSKEGGKIIGRFGKISRNVADCPTPLANIKDSDVPSPTPTMVQPNPTVATTEPDKTKTNPITVVTRTGNKKPKPTATKTDSKKPEPTVATTKPNSKKPEPTVIITKPNGKKPEQTVTTINKPAKSTVIIEPKPSVINSPLPIIDKDCSAAVVIEQKKWTTVNRQKVSLEQQLKDSLFVLAQTRALLGETETKLKAEQKEKEHYADLLRRIRESIAATVQHTDRLRSIFSQQATSFKAEFDKFANTIKVVEKSYYAATKERRPLYDRQLLDLRAHHESRIKTMWLTLDSVQAYKDISDTLLYNVYTYSTPARNPKPLPAHLNVPATMPTPKQLAKWLQVVDRSSDDANLMRLVMIENYADVVMPLISGGIHKSNNKLASQSFKCISELLLSTAEETPGKLQHKIEKGFVEEIMLSVYPSILENQFALADSFFNLKKYADALRIYIDTEKNFDKRAVVSSSIDKSRYNYGVMLLWNLGDFEQKKILFKGRTRAIIDDRVDRGRRQLLTLEKSNSSFKDKAMLALAKYSRPNS